MRNRVVGGGKRNSGVMGVRMHGRMAAWQDFGHKDMQGMR